MPDLDLDIPVEHRDVFRRIAELPESEFERLVRLAESGSSGGRVDTLRAAINSGGFGESDEVDWGRALLSAMTTRAHLHQSAEAVAKAVAAELHLDRADDGDAANAYTRLVRLLSIPDLFTTAKVHDLSTTFERQFIDGRIVSDLRPVFDEEISQPTGVLVVHTLEIRYTVDGGLEAIYLSLEDDDLSSLSAQLLRAREKSIALTQFLEKTGVKQLGVNGDTQ